MFGSAAKAAIVLDVGEGRRTVEIAGEKQTQHLYVYMDDESVKGKIVVNLGKGTKEVEHKGIRVDFIGQIGTLLFRLACAPERRLSRESIFSYLLPVYLLYRKCHPS